MPFLASAERLRLAGRHYRTHNPMVAGSNLAPATKNLQILHAFRFEFGDHFCVLCALGRRIANVLPEDKASPQQTAAEAQNESRSVALEAVD